MISKYTPFFLFIISIFVMDSCDTPPDTLFKLIPPDESGVFFANRIQDNDTLNILTEEYIYNGGGVAVGDFNRDGLQDLFFTGNVVPNHLYLNAGKLKFKDISEESGVAVSGRWSSSAAVVDINNDGWLDIYVCTTMLKDSAARKNMLFINQGLNNDSIPTFSNQADKYGLEDGGYSVASSFFDFDLDGDLDLYLLINQRLKNVPTNYREKIVDGSAPNNDRLYRNNGNGTFTDISLQAGVVHEGFGLGLSTADFNKDGWPDLYVSNDYLSNDILYINNRNGTFSNQIKEFIGHQSQFSMGNDAADINNDGLSDIITLDMLPETNLRKKSTIGNKSYQTYINNETFGYEYQYVRNMLHLNNGLNQNIKFSEIGQLAGVYQTEWSWSPLFADFDNDGYKDLIITNGFPKDITDKDFGNYRSDVGNVASTRHLIDSIPVVKIANYAFRNNGDLKFGDVSKDWGVNQPSFSNGAAFTDLDNDGDLDYVVNNINDPAFVYENTLYTSSKKEKTDQNNFCRVQLNGTGSNKNAIGAKVELYYNGGMLQYGEQFTSRGFLSSVENVLHFGLGKANQIDSVIVTWPDGQIQKTESVGVNKLTIIGYSPNVDHRQITPNSLLVAQVETEDLNISFKHVEADKIDYNLQRTIPHKLSQLGPGISVGDINQDKLEDFIIGGSLEGITSVFIQKPDGTFMQEPSSIPADAKTSEDEGLLLFDADSDGDLDLYKVSGSMESNQPDYYYDRLYYNNGKAKFELNKNALPEIASSGSCVRASDYDGDGDLDLFVGGRTVPGSYPLPAQSSLLQNNKGIFTDITNVACPALSKPGMVADALWTDIDNDNKVDLIVVGEFMPIRVYKNSGSGKLEELSETGIGNYTGWWNSIAASDFDFDGDIDYVIGNLGLNNSYQVTEKYQLRLVAKDFDGNGSVDPVLGCYMRESMTSDIKKLYPIHFWDELNSQSPKFRNKFARYKQYGRVTLDELLPESDQKDATILEANHMESSYVENLGNGKFRLVALPMLTQTSPVNGLITDDVNHDGNQDVIMVGNDYGNEVFVGRLDAFIGLVLLGNGKGSFEATSAGKSGFYVGGDAKGLAKLSGVKSDYYVATQNRDSLRIFSPVKQTDGLFVPSALDNYAELIFNDGRKSKVEFYYGSGYLSQSTRSIRIPKDVKEIVVYDSKGGSRKIATGSI